MVREMTRDYGEREAVYLEMKYDNPDKAAILFSDGEDEFWIPRSILDPMEENVLHIKDEEYEVFLPIWFAEQEGLI